MSNKVGPKSPISSRFQKGKSGNPKGRPKKAKPEKTGSAFDLIIDKRLTVTQGGVPREVTVDEALQHRTLKDAIAGNRSARREVLKMIAKREKALAARDKRTYRSVDLLTEPVDPDNANAALLILGIACHNPWWVDRDDKDNEYERLLLEPWAVQAALSRRRGGSRLTDEDVREIKRCTRDAGALRWPRGTVG